MSSSDEEKLSSGVDSDEELSSDDITDEDIDKSFGKQYEELLNQEIPEGKCPILCFSKIPAKIAKQRAKLTKDEKEKESIKKVKKALLNQYHVEFSEFNVDDEKVLRKKATQGVIELFGAIAKAQNKTNPAQLQTSKQEEKTPETADDFLDILNQAASSK